MPNLNQSTKDEYHTQPAHVITGTLNFSNKYIETPKSFYWQQVYCTFQKIATLSTFIMHTNDNLIRTSHEICI